MTGDPSPERGRVAFLGLGTMGAAMAANLARAGFTVTGWNRTPGRADELADLGVVMAPTAAQAVADSAIVVICVSDTPDVEAVLFGPDGVVDGARPGTLIVDCSTIAPSGSWDFAARLAERELRMVDAPVSGGSEGARNATLTIFVGGDAADVEKARPVLTAMGRTITHVGPIGAGQAVKAVNQVILAGTYLGVAEGIVLAIKAGLDVEQVIGALGGGAAQSWVLANRSGRMLANDYPLGFKVALHRKDLGIALDLAGQLGARPARQRPGRPARDRPRGRRPRRRRHVRPGPRDPGLVRARVLTLRPALVEADQEHRVAQLSVVAGPEPFRVVHRRDVHPARPERRVGQAGVGVLAVLDRHHPSGDATLDEVHRDVGERRGHQRVERIGLAAPEVVGQLGRERLDAGPVADLERQRLADVRLVAMAERVGAPDVDHLRALPDRPFGGDDERVVARVGRVVGGQQRGTAHPGRTAPRG